MTGTIVAIIPKQRFDYSFLGSNLDKSVVIHKALNVIPYKTGRLMVRVHSIQMGADLLGQPNLHRFQRLAR
jgi:hypothetical protein